MSNNYFYYRPIYPYSIITIRVIRM